MIRDYYVEKSFACDNPVFICWCINHGPLSLILFNFDPSVDNSLHPNNVVDEIAYPFSNFNSAVTKVWECIVNSIPHFTGHVNIHAGIKINPIQ